jgi:hypothetical protein
MPADGICCPQQSRLTQTATQTAPQKQKGDRFDSVAFLGYLGKPLIYLEFFVVAWDGIEPSTRGFSIRCSTN